MDPIKIKPRVIKVTLKKEENITLGDGQAYAPLKVETKEEAMRACLHMVLKHTADMFVTICEIVAEEYKLDSEEMVKTIRASPRFENVCADDVLLTLGYLDSKNIVEKVEEAPAVLPEKPKRKPRAPKAVAPIAVVPGVEPPKAEELPKADELPKSDEPAPTAIKKVKVRVVSKVNT